MLDKDFTQFLIVKSINFYLIQLLSSDSWKNNNARANARAQI